MTDGHFRRGPRVAADLKVAFRRDAPEAVMERAGRIVDLGMGGAFVEAERPPPVGAEIVLTLSAPTAWDLLEIPAEVRWVSDEGERGLGRGFGLKFRALAPTQATALYELLASSTFEEER